MKPITRWNRWGLSHFRYIDGNAVTFFADLVRQYRSRFIKDEPFSQKQKDDADSVDSLLLYNNRSTDWGVEMLRSFTRSSHVLTEHINDYANEMSVATAQKWESLRKLSKMVNYIPSPPASAAAYLALSIKDKKSGVVQPGLQIKSRPGSAAQLIFETITETPVDWRLNSFRASGYNISPEILHGNSLAFKGRLDDLKAGVPMLISDENNGNAHACTLQTVIIKKDKTVIHFSPSVSQKSLIRKGHATVYCNPEVAAEVYGPAATQVNLQQAVMLKEKPDLLRGDIICISDGQRTRFAKVRTVKGRNLIIDIDKNAQDKNLGSFNISRTYVSRALEVSVSGVFDRKSYISILKIPGEWLWLSGADIADIAWVGSGNKFKVVQGAHVESVDYHVPGKDAPEERKEGYSYVRISHADLACDFDNPQKILVMPRARQWKADSFLDQLANKNSVEQVICKNDDKIATGEYAVVKRGSQLSWGKLKSVSANKERAGCRLENLQARGGGLYYLSETKLFTAFKKKLKCLEYMVNNTPVLPGRIVPDDPAILNIISAGRIILVESGQNFYEALICEVNKEDKYFSVSIKNPDINTVFTISGTSFLGNTCKAYHGKTVTQKVFSSGNERTSWFKIPIEDKDVSFIPDTMFSSGVAADLVAVINGKKWNQVESLQNSADADSHFMVELQDNGSLLICFGDGLKGKMIPPGVNNIKITYRRGNGLEGNCAAGVLEKPAKPHKLVKAVVQPLSAFGGNSREPEDSLRTHISDKLFAMNRAVSASDFARLASLHSSVWQAAAFKKTYRSSRSKIIEVVVVPAAGTALHEDVQTNIKNFLESRAIPGVVVEVRAYIEHNPHFKVELYIDSSRYDGQSIKALAKNLLLRQFSLKKSRLGESLLVGKFYKIIEAIEGVEYSKIFINKTLLKTEYPVDRDTIACLDEAGSNLEIYPMEYHI